VIGTSNLQWKLKRKATLPESQADYKL